ncbi:MAG: alpha/beta hydrolase family protein [Chlamydiales bacterium]
MRMKILLIFINLMFVYKSYTEEITPYKYTDSIPLYNVPASSRFMVKRADPTAPDIIYYFTKPKSNTYPIAIICSGSSDENDLQSIIHFHRYFIQEFLDLNMGLVTLEQRGIDNNIIDKKEFVEHYTLSNRLQDHRVVIEYLQANPPEGWNGKFVFLGVSEGGPIVLSLTTEYSDNVAATVNWCGAVDCSWREHLWAFIHEILIKNPECPHEIRLNDCDVCLDQIRSRKDYDQRMDSITCNATGDLHFLGMTYKYHADAMLYPDIDYKKIRTPLLIVAGTKDLITPSTNVFVEKAKVAGVDITYICVEDMDHYIRKRPDIINKTFEWLKNIQ